MTCALGPLRPFLLRKPEVNPIWDPIFSLGFTFVHNGVRHNDTNPSSSAILGWLFMAFAFCVITVSAYRIGKSHIAEHWKWFLLVAIAATLLINISVEAAARIHWLHFFIIEIS
jgi:hypothetical protein